MCRKKALNYQSNDGGELYYELFGVAPADKIDDETRETEKERQDRELVGKQNREKFQAWVVDNIADKLYQDLLLRAPVVDTRAFNKHNYRPLIPEQGIIDTLLAYGVQEAVARDMVKDIGEFPANRAAIQKGLCEHTCTRCHQHELKDGTKILGYKPVRTTMDLEVAPWSDWHTADPRSGDRKGLGRGYVMDLCNRCWTNRRPNQIKYNDMRRRRRARIKADLEFHAPKRSSPGEVVSASQHQTDTLIDGCEVHRTSCEKQLWVQFTKLQGELELMKDPGKRRQHKLQQINRIGCAFNMTTDHCMLRYNKWPSRQRKCERRVLDRVLNKVFTKRLSAWRHLLEGTWRTSEGLVSLTTVISNKRKLLQWHSIDSGAKRLLRVRRKKGTNGELWEQFVLAGGSSDRVVLWLVNTTASTDNKIIWRAHDSSFCKLDESKDIVYTRVRIHNNIN